MLSIQNLYKSIITIGLSDQSSEHEYKNTKLINRVSSFICLGSFLGFNWAMFYTQNPLDIATYLMFGVLYALVFIFNHFTYYKLSLLYFILIGPLLTSLIILAGGGDFGQNILMGAFIIFTSYVYQKQIKLRVGLVLFQIFLYVLPSVYICLYGPLLGLLEFKFDEIITFVCSMIVISYIFFLYDKNSKQYINELKQQHKRLNEKTIELERFNHIASHDLKSPLTNISNFIGLMQKDLVNKKYDNLSNYLNYAETGAFEIKELIDGVQQISRNSYEQNIQDQYEVDLNLALSTAIQNLESEIKEKNAEIEITSMPTYFSTEADFVYIFQNFIQNGIRYNQSSIPKIKVTSETTSNKIIIHIKDNGIGIAEKHYAEIFEYFKRLHNKSEYPGTGLGLGLCKKIIDKYNGHINIHSELGAHTCFSISLPIGNKISKKSNSLSRKALS